MTEGSYFTLVNKRVWKAFLLLVLGLSWASVADNVADNAWDRHLPEAVFHDVRIEGELITDVWQSLLRSEFLRCVLFTKGKVGIVEGSAFSFRAEQATGAEILDAFGAFFGYQWFQDEVTGIVWIIPGDCSPEEVLSGEILVPQAIRGAPIISGLLPEVMVTDVWPEHPLVCLDASPFRSPNSHALPADLAPGKYTIRRLLSLLCMEMPPTTFYVTAEPYYPFCSAEVLPVFIPMSEGPDVADGAVAFWARAFGQGKSREPEPAEIWERLDSKLPSERQIARQYLEMNYFVIRIQRVKRDAMSHESLRVRMWGAYSEMPHAIWGGGLQWGGIPPDARDIFESGIREIRNQPEGNRDLVLMAVFKLLQLTHDMDSARESIKGFTFSAEDFAAVAPEINATLWFYEGCVELLLEVLKENGITLESTSVVLPVAPKSALEVVQATTEEDIGQSPTHDASVEPLDSNKKVGVKADGEITASEKRQTKNWAGTYFAAALVLALVLAGLVLWYYRRYLRHRGI